MSETRQQHVCIRPGFVRTADGLIYGDRYKGFGCSTARMLTAERLLLELAAEMTPRNTVRPV
jgi:hypothetical protein